MAEENKIKSVSLTQKLWFTVVFDLALLGLANVAINCHDFYKDYSQYKPDLAKLSDQELNDISKQAFIIQQERRKVDKG